MKQLLGLLALAAAAPASAEVVSAAPNGFHLRQSVTVPRDAETAYSSFAKVERWWSASHTYGGDAAKLSIELTPGGCFCEHLASGGIEHMRVTYMDVPKRLVLTGALGPLLYEAVAGTMDLKFEAAGSGTRVTMDYKAAGFASGGADKLAPLVDKVLAEQMMNYAVTMLPD